MCTFHYSLNVTSVSDLRSVEDTPIQNKDSSSDQTSSEETTMVFKTLFHFLLIEFPGFVLIGL